MPRTRTVLIALAFLSTSVWLGCGSSSSVRRTERLENRILTLENVTVAKLEIDMVKLRLDAIEDEVVATKESRPDTITTSTYEAWAEAMTIACLEAASIAADIATDLAAIEEKLAAVETALATVDDAATAVELYELLLAALAEIESQIREIDEEVQTMKEGRDEASGAWLPIACPGFAETLDAAEKALEEATAAVAAAREKIAGGK
ncbi:MAG: hypothetical protein ACKVU1_05130 [bacterium]